MCHIINKIAFVITDTTTWHHLKNIINALPEDAYDIVIANEKQASQGLYMTIRGFIRKCVGFTNGINLKKKNLYSKILKNAKNINDIIAGDFKYRCAICVFPDMSGKAGNRLKLELIAEKLIRAAFISGAYSYMLDLETNKKFDYILCCGKEQKKAYTQLDIKAEVLDLGNPRLLWSSSYCIEEDPIYKQLDKNKKTILWIPSHGRKSCSLVNYLSIFSELQKDFNVVVSFPPGLYEDFCFLRWKLEKHIKIVINNRDSASLMNLADFIFCDYGGSLLTSIYFEKNVCLLNAKKENISIVERNFGKNSPEMILRKDIVSFNPTDTCKNFLNVLKDNTIWETQEKLRQDIKKNYFSESSENSIRKISTFLLGLIDVLQKSADKKQQTESDSRI